MDNAQAGEHSIYEKLTGRYGAESVVFDVDTIPRGVDFVDYLRQQVAECDVVLAIIGDRWLDVLGADGRRRIDQSKRLRANRDSGGIEARDTGHSRTGRKVHGAQFPRTRPASRHHERVRAAL
jgi:hypothetical protein